MPNAIFIVNFDKVWSAESFTSSFLSLVIVIQFIFIFNKVLLVHMLLWKKNNFVADFSSSPPFPLLLGFGLLLQVRMDPRNNTDYESLWYEKIPQLTEEDLKGQEGGYMYRYRYNGSGATQVWLSSSRYIL